MGCSDDSELYDEGIALIDEVIACEPGGWVRSVLVDNLKEDTKGQIEFLEQQIEICRILANATPEPTREPRTSFSPEALDLLATYHELLRFKDETWFHIYCLAPNGPAANWHAYLDSGAFGDINGIIDETGIVPGDLYGIAVEYCDSAGQETDFTEHILGRMEHDWLNYSPVPPVNPTAQAIVDRPYMQLAEDLAVCIWNNPTMRVEFDEILVDVYSVQEFVLTIEAALEDATTTQAWDGAIATLTTCEAS